MSLNESTCSRVSSSIPPGIGDHKRGSTRQYELVQTVSKSEMAQ